MTVRLDTLPLLPLEGHEEPGVLDDVGKLGGHRAQSEHILIAEGVLFPALDGQGADSRPAPKDRNRQKRLKLLFQDSGEELEVGVDARDRLAHRPQLLHGQPHEPLAQLEPDLLHRVRAQAPCRLQDELLPLVVVQVDRAYLGLHVIRDDDDDALEKGLGALAVAEDPVQLPDVA